MSHRVRRFCPHCLKRRWAWIRTDGNGRVVEDPIEDDCEARIKAKQCIDCAKPRQESKRCDECERKRFRPRKTKPVKAPRPECASDDCRRRPRKGEKLCTPCTKRAGKPKPAPKAKPPRRGPPCPICGEPMRGNALRSCKKCQGIAQRERLKEKNAA